MCHQGCEQCASHSRDDVPGDAACQHPAAEAQEAVECIQPDQHQRYGPQRGCVAGDEYVVEDTLDQKDQGTGNGRVQKHEQERECQPSPVGAEPAQQPSRVTHGRSRTPAGPPGQASGASGGGLLHSSKTCQRATGRGTRGLVVGTYAVTVLGPERS